MHLPVHSDLEACFLPLSPSLSGVRHLPLSRGGHRSDGRQHVKLHVIHNWWRCMLSRIAKRPRRVEWVGHAGEGVGESGAESQLREGGE